MYALIKSFPGKPQPTQVALAGPCPHQPRVTDQRSKPITLAERRERGAIEREARGVHGATPPRRSAMAAGA